MNYEEVYCRACGHSGRVHSRNGCEDSPCKCRKDYNTVQREHYGK